MKRDSIRPGSDGRTGGNEAVFFDFHGSRSLSPETV